MGTLHGDRTVGSNAMILKDDPLGPSLVVGGFFSFDTFTVPYHTSSRLPPPNTEVRVQERGWGECPCCKQYQPQVRGGGVGVIECKASDTFKFYAVDNTCYQLLLDRP